MLQILNWEYRKPIIKKFVKNICNMLTKIFGGNSDIAGWFVVYFLHNLPYTLLMYRILFYKVEKWSVKSDGTPDQNIQNFYFPNANEIDKHHFTDTQVKYGNH